MDLNALRNERDVWESEILDFLSWRGASIFGDWTPKTASELVKRLGGPDWETVVVLNVVASTSFVQELQRAIRLASRELVHDRVGNVRLARGRLRGRVLARETLRARARKADPTIWVTETSKRQWQTEANAAVVGFLEHIRRVCAKHVADGGLIPTVDAIEAIDRLLGTVPLRHVAPDPAWASFAMPPWLTAKHEFYRSIWKWAGAFRAARRTRDARELRAQMKGGWLAAESRDQLFELYALSQLTMALHEHTTWDHFRVASAASGSSTLTVEATDGQGLHASIRFDRKPPTPGVYGALLRKYAGVDGRGRRPDLQLALTRGTKRAITLIEVKATEPNSTYGRDSIVKVFGYLKDFAELWPEPNEPYPRAALLYAGEVQPKVALTERLLSDEVILTSASHFRSDLNAILQAQDDYVLHSAPPLPMSMS